MLRNILTSSSILSFFLVGKALAGVYITNPVSSTIAQGGQSLNVQWVDDGSSPLLPAIGPSDISICTGSATQQTCLLSLGESVDVSKTNSLTSLIEPGIGPDGTFYFIRVQSKNLTDSANPKYPYQAFSARFQLQNMSGSFNTTVQSQVNGANSTTNGPVGGAGAANSTGNASGSSISPTGAANSTGMATSTRAATSAGVSPPSRSAASSSTVSGTVAAATSTGAASTDLGHVGISTVVVGAFSLLLAVVL